MSPEDYEKLLIVNNAAWCIGEITYKIADSQIIKKMIENGEIVEIVKTFGDILSQDIIEQIS
jgi:hypothetical protein